MGAFSRNKGSRCERALRDHLRKLGYDSHRVPLSGAAANFKGDVVAIRDGVTHLLELKCRAKSFTKIYNFFNKFQKAGSLRFYHGEPRKGVAISMSYDFGMVKRSDGLYENSLQFIVNHKPYIRTLNRIVNMQKLLGEAHYLVIRDDRAQFLFLSYI